MEDKLAAMVIGGSKATDRFDLKYHGFTLKLGIPFLSPRTMIRMHRILKDIPEVTDNGQSVFQAILENSQSLRKVCKAIAVATGTMFPCIVAKAIANAPMNDVETLWRIVLKNSDSDAFFFIIGSVKKMNLLQTKEE